MSYRAGRGKPSAAHPNRQAHNWSIYDAGDRLLLRYQDRFRGIVLDLGCGQRIYEPFLLRSCHRYFGVDWSESLHGIAADALADLNRPFPFCGDSVDTVVTFSVMEHLQRPREFLAETFRVLKPGGWIVLQVPFMWWVHEAPVDYFRYTCYGLELLFREAGFVEIDVVPTTGFWTMWFLKLNYQLNRLVRGPAVLRTLVRWSLVLPFWLDQKLGPFLDRFWPKGANETAGYFVAARKA